VPLHIVERKGKNCGMKHKFEIEYKGAKISCDSLEDATRLLRNLGEAAPIHSTPWSAHEFEALTDRLRLLPRMLLAALIESKMAYLTDAQLREKLGLTNNRVLAGVLSGVSKVALALDIEPQRIYGQSTSYVQGKPQRRYWVTTAFNKAAIDNDWPSEADLKEDPDEFHPDWGNHS
jgi:hypothetical protein